MVADLEAWTVMMSAMVDLEARAARATMAYLLPHVLSLPRVDPFGGGAPLSARRPLPFLPLFFIRTKSSGAGEEEPRFGDMETKSCAGEGRSGCGRGGNVTGQIQRLGC